MTRAGASGPLLLYVLMAAFVVGLAWMTAVRPVRSGPIGASDEAVLMTLGDDDRPASWDAFFARHPLPDDAIRERIIASNAATPGDVVCVPLEAEGAETSCR